MRTWSACLNESGGELMLAKACFSFPKAEWYIGNEQMRAYRGLSIDDFDFGGLRVLDKDGDKWIKLNSLGDKVSFLGAKLYYSFSVLASELLGCKRNCIDVRCELWLCQSGKDLIMVSWLYMTQPI